MHRLRLAPAARGPVWLLLIALGLAGCARVHHDPRHPPVCRVDPEPARVARFLPAAAGATGGPVYGLVLEVEDGVPTRVLDLDAWVRDQGTAVDPAWNGTVSATLFDVADAVWRDWRRVRDAEQADPALERFAEPTSPDAICSPVSATRDEIESGQKVVLGAGLNYAAHAQEAGGGGVFVFPKPIPPTGPYRTVTPPEELLLLDYEVELAFVALEDLDLHALPDEAGLEQRIAYLAANDLSDRHAILRRQPVIGTSTGYAEAKGKPGFLPLGPWMVRGPDLAAFAGRCARPLRLQLEVEEAGGTRTLRQDASSSLMRLEPRELLAMLAERVNPQEEETLLSPMTVVRGGVERVFRMAGVVDRRGVRRAVLPAGSIVLTGTPEGTAFRAPSRVRLLGRSLLNLRAPVDQLIEELERSREREGYLSPGDVVVARIEGLGTQRFAIAPPDPSGGPPDRCEEPLAASDRVEED